MFFTINRIQRANAKDLDKLLDAVIRRYSVVHPDWDLVTFSLNKSSDEAEQFDRIINFLQKLKNFPAKEGISGDQ